MLKRKRQKMKNNIRRRWDPEETDSDGNRAPISLTFPGSRPTSSSKI